jgi:glycosyltransferase involved in cell wall biosynthesis
VGCIGRTEPTKGTRDVFDGFQIAVARGFRGTLKVAYGGPEHPVLNSPLCQVVVPKNDLELGEFYRSVDVIIAPGTVQLGAVHYPVLESMASRVPVINTGYAPSDESNSWIVPVHAPESIADTLIEMSRQPALRLSRAERAVQAVKSFAWETVSADFIRLINSNPNLPQQHHSILHGEQL